jgi:hypothetical protein
MAYWVKIGEGSEGARFINLDSIAYIEYKEPVNGNNAIIIFFDGTHAVVDSEREPNAFAKIMAYLETHTGFNPYAEEGEPEGEDEVSES